MTIEVMTMAHIQITINKLKYCGGQRKRRLFFLDVQPVCRIYIMEDQLEVARYTAILIVEEDMHQDIIEISREIMNDRQVF